MNTMKLRQTRASAAHFGSHRGLRALAAAASLVAAACVVPELLEAIVAVAAREGATEIAGVTRRLVAVFPIATARLRP